MKVLSAFFIYFPSRGFLTPRSCRSLVFPFLSMPRINMSSDNHIHGGCSFFPQMILLLGFVSINFIQPRSLLAENISLKRYSSLSIPVTNPVDLTQLPRNEMFQVKDEQFILQFYFNELDIFGAILKRNIKLPLYVRWCFFRSCEESSFDYTVLIAAPFQQPFAKGFFVINFPPNIQYNFQGLMFTTPQ